jgi:microcin-processing metallopeptidase PmbA/TldD-like protein
VGPTRREVLAVLGAGAAGAALASLSLGCGPSTGRGPRAPKAAAAGGADVRTLLRAAVEQLRVEFPIVAAHAVIARRTTAAIDLHGRGVVRRQHAAVVLRVDDGRGHATERATGSVTADAIAALVAGLRTTKIGAAPSIKFGTPARFDTETSAERTDAGWLDLVEALDGRAAAHATSRVIYRAAWLDTDDATVWHVGAAQTGGAFDREQRLIRSRAGVVLMSWSGTAPMVGEIERGAVGGPDQVALSDADVEGAAKGALELTTPGTVPAGDVAVVLMPSVVARLAEVAIAPVLTTAAWGRPDLRARSLAGTRIGADAITIAADPDPTRYGGFHFDDEGATGAAARVIDAGVLRGPVGDRAGAAAVTGAFAGHGLRPGHAGPVEPAIGHLAWAPGAGTADPDALVGDLDAAWIIDGGGAAHVDPIGWTATIAVSRARKVAAGAVTGHVFADCELTCDVPALLAATTRVSSTVETFVRRDGGGADARWRSVEVPAIATRARITPRRPT